MAASTESRLNKKLYTDCTRLKLLDTETANPRFRVLETPFTGNQEQDQLNAQQQQEFLIIGQIFPNSKIYNERSYKIEMKLTKAFPMDPPEVRFLTPIYHPNIEENGKFSNDLLVKTAEWSSTTSLVKVIEIVTEHIDKPNIDYSIRAEVGREYQENREQFNRHALEWVRKHGLPRQ